MSHVVFYWLFVGFFSEKIKILVQQIRFCLLFSDGVSDSLVIKHLVEQPPHILLVAAWKHFNSQVNAFIER